MGAAPELFSCELGKPSFDLIDPGRRRGREVHVVVRPPRQPRFDYGGFMRGVIVHDDVNVDVMRDAGIDLLKKVQKFCRPMPLVAFTDHETGSDVECREQRRRAVADIRIGSAFGNARHHRQDRLLAIQGLYLAHMGICGSRCSYQDSMVNLRS